ncbi:hypothetical protein Slala05_76380 [Streptomyces lavendulae subsp. lavendulae]|nr:hypothetical protein Slala05_76380 [Streptomyces lavendulae subsp. lavendulae]
MDSPKPARSARRARTTPAQQPAAPHTLLATIERGTAFRAPWRVPDGTPHPVLSSAARSSM